MYLLDSLNDLQVVISWVGRLQEKGKAGWTLVAAGKSAVRT